MKSWETWADLTVESFDQEHFLIRHFLSSPFQSEFPVILRCTHWDQQSTHHYFQACCKVWQMFLQWFSPVLHCFPLPKWNQSWNELQFWIHTQLPDSSNIIPLLEQHCVSGQGAALAWRWLDKPHPWLWKDFGNELQACISWKCVLCSVLYLWAVPRAQCPEVFDTFLTFCCTRVVHGGSLFLSASSGSQQSQVLPAQDRKSVV